MTLSALPLFDWRCRVRDLYTQVRATYRHDPAEAHAHWRTGRDELFASHPASPLSAADREGFTGLPVAPYDPAYAFVAPVDTEVDQARFEVASSTGEVMVYERIGAVELPLGRLELLWLRDYAGGLFLPFRDGSCGELTYGGGRYLLDTPKSADLGTTEDERLVLDFNFAYHPSCFHDPAFSCPLAPPGNHIEATVEVGELAVRP